VRPTLLGAQDDIAGRFFDQADAARFRAGDFEDGFQRGVERLAEVERLADAGGNGVERGEIIDLPLNFVGKHLISGEQLLVFSHDGDSSAWNSLIWMVQVSIKLLSHYNRRKR